MGSLEKLFLSQRSLSQRSLESGFHRYITAIVGIIQKPGFTRWLCLLSIEWYHLHKHGHFQCLFYILFYYFFLYLVIRCKFVIPLCLIGHKLLFHFLPAVWVMQSRIWENIDAAIFNKWERFFVLAVYGNRRSKL